MILQHTHKLFGAKLPLADLQTHLTPTLTPAFRTFFPKTYPSSSPLSIRTLLTLAPPRAKPSSSSSSSSQSSLTASSRLSLIHRHLDHRIALPDLNTPYSTERGYVTVEPDDVEYKPLDRTKGLQLDQGRGRSASTQTRKMDETAKGSAQKPHPALMIPGPIEFSDEVLGSMGFYAYVSFSGVCSPR